MKPLTTPRHALTPPHKSPLEPRPKHRVCFEVEAPPGSVVSVVGSFNRWTAGSHPLHPGPDEPGLYRRVMLLPDGLHEYKFVIDGEWSADPNCPRWVFNKFKTLNSVLALGST